MLLAFWRWSSWVNGTLPPWGDEFFASCAYNARDKGSSFYCKMDAGLPLCNVPHWVAKWHAGIDFTCSRLRPLHMPLAEPAVSLPDGARALEEVDHREGRVRDERWMWERVIWSCCSADRRNMLEAKRHQHVQAPECPYLILIVHHMSR